VVIAGGGTGGHLYPGIALAQKFKKRLDAEIMFIGTSYGIENRVLPKLPYRFEKIWMRGLQRKMSMANVLFPIRLMVSLVQTTALFVRFHPNVVIGTGGYVSAPALLAGLTLRIPTVIQEQNSYPGLVNRLLGKWVNQVHLTYEDSVRYFKRKHGMFVSGNPVRGDFNHIEKSAALQKFGLQTNKATLLIFGGSQGARAINEAVLQSLESLMAGSDVQLLWAVGEPDWETVSTKVAAFSSRIYAQPYIDDMAAAYAAADMVVCRAGATTLAEIALCGLPAILIPYPYATAGHQVFNAKSMEQAGAAIVIEQKDLTVDGFLKTVTDLLKNEATRCRMSEAAKRVARPDAAADIVHQIETLI